MDVVDTPEKDEVKDHESNQDAAREKRRIPKGKPEGYGTTQPKNLL